jgi:hypothetical protein
MVRSTSIHVVERASLQVEVKYILEQMLFTLYDYFTVIVATVRCYSYFIRMLQIPFGYKRLLLHSSSRHKNYCKMSKLSQLILY